MHKLAYNYVHTFNLNTPASCKTSDRNVPELIIAQSALVDVQAMSEIKLPNSHHYRNKLVGMHAYNQEFMTEERRGISYSVVICTNVYHKVVISSSYVFLKC